MKLKLKFKIRNIIGYEDLYLIDREGNVYGKTSKKFLKPYLNRDGYLTVQLSKNNKHKDFSIHRLIAIHFKPNPDNLPEVDHIDRDRLNNSIDNLRWVTRSQQSKNKGIRTDNSSGFTGVYPYKGKYGAQITIDGKTKFLGYYDIAEEAHEVRKAEAIKLFGEFNPN